MESNTNMHIQTLAWLDKQIDDIHAQSVLVGELLLDEDDPKIIEKYDNKLAELEKELENIDNKINFERSILNK